VIHLGFGVLTLLLLVQYGLAFNRSLRGLRVLALGTLLAAVVCASLFLVERCVGPTGVGYVFPLVAYDLAALVVLAHWLWRPCRRPARRPARARVEPEGGEVSVAAGGDPGAD